MAKQTYYFSHDYNARNDEKILELRAKFGAEGYGIFWMLIETMAENDNCGVKASLIGGLSLGYGIPKGRLQEIIDACVEIGLLLEENGYYFSIRLLSHKEMRKKFIESGRKGAELRWGGYRGGIREGYAKESKVKEKKEKKENKEKKEIPDEPQPSYPIPQNFGRFYLPKYKVVVFEDETCQPLTDLELELLETRQLRSWLIKKDFSAAKPLSEVVGEDWSATRRTETAQISPEIEK